MAVGVVDAYVIEVLSVVGLVVVVTDAVVRIGSSQVDACHLAAVTQAATVAAPVAPHVIDVNVGAGSIAVVGVAATAPASLDK